jgi:hypothetical protein
LIGHFLKSPAALYFAIRLDRHLAQGSLALANVSENSLSFS